MKRILLTGAAGFLGSHLTDALLESNYEVIGVDNFYTGNKSNIVQHLTNPNFELMRHDVTHSLDVEADFILNFACPASPVHYQQNPVQTMQTSILGISNLLHLAKMKQIPILQASTSEVYGDPTVSPQNELYWGNVNPIGIRACYDEGKRAAETLMFDYHRQFDVQVKIARIFNTYGPRMSFEDGRVVSNFIYQAIRNKPITIYGDGSQTRSFCFVTDLVNAVISFMNTGPEISGPINIGNPNEITMTELATSIKSLTDSKSEIIFLPLPKDDPKQRRPDISKAREDLNWEPKVGIQAGLELTIEDFRKRLLSIKPTS